MATVFSRTIRNGIVNQSTDDKGQSDPPENNSHVHTNLSFLNKIEIDEFRRLLYRDQLILIPLIAEEW